MAKVNVLVIEDESDIQELLHYNLTKEGYTTTIASTGEDGVKVAQSGRVDVILLDLMLPQMDGIEVCRALRADPRTRSTPIIMITAKGEESDIVTGLEVGADDYIAKPFSPKVVIARIRTILRRKRSESSGSEQPTLRCGALLIHPGRHEALIDEKPISLTVTEFRILHLLARRPGWVFTRQQIVDGVRGEEYAVTERAVDVQIVGLRKKLGAYGKNIETVRGIGYRLKD
ncbi:MAG: response regulator transcription factor [Kiritimatiellae bacterium]|nr:response regulator transcription factor [Kiritimatiellia bacterium]MCO5061691.1 response regulator transcription factor [Kiritimatiellia bacterium]MCO6401231.1 response regulator transcription factor [Verrucomicrobiota bacterium]